jgi:glycosyltransferase involved in cell wall biosynthesis
MSAAFRAKAPSPELSIIIPARNEARSVQTVLRTVRSIFPDAEILLVDNGSTDGTATLATHVEGVRVITETRAGKGHAMRAGAQAALGEYLLFHDADTEYEVSDARAVVARAFERNGCAIGVRHVSFERLRWSSWLANRLIQALLRLRFGLTVSDVLSGTRCMRKSEFLGLATRSAGFGIETEIAVACLKSGIPVHYADVRYTPRSGAEGKKIRPYHLFSLVRIALS